MDATPPAFPADDADTLRAALAARTAELAALRAEMEDFFRAASHDLRAPLRHLGAFSGLLRERLGELGNDPEATEYLVSMDDATRQLGQMVDGLLELSRVGRAPLELQPLDLAALLAEVRQRLAPEIANRQIDWQVAPVLPTCSGDRALVRQMLDKLLSNAVKFTRRTPDARIVVDARHTTDGHVQISIRDNGAGFNPAQAGRLFGIFERLHSVSEFEGLGVGLAVVRRIVDRHGGTVAADGAVHAGCRVRVTLPG